MHRIPGAPAISRPVPSCAWPGIQRTRSPSNPIQCKPKEREVSEDDKLGNTPQQSFLRGLTQPRLSRQNFLRGAAGATLTALAPQFARAEKVTDWAAWWASQKPTDEFVF